MTTRSLKFSQRKRKKKNSKQVTEKYHKIPFTHFQYQQVFYDCSSPQNVFIAALIHDKLFTGSLQLCTLVKWHNFL